MPTARTPTLHLTRVTDSACAPLAARIEQSRMPRQMRVHPAVFDCIRSLRLREIADGYPLLFLGMELVASDSVPVDGFEFVD